MKKYLSSLAVVGILLTGCGAGTVYNVSTPSIQQSVSKEQMKKAILAAAQRFNWVILKMSNNKIIAEYRRNKIMAKISITYSAHSYEINYIDSKNLKYDGSHIHKAYNKWIHNLEKEINTNLSLIANGAKFDIPVVAQTTASELSTTPSSETTTENTQPSKYQCKQTFNFTGSIWKGRVITAKQSISHISKQEAVTQAASVLSTEGFIVDTTSPSVGLISAHEVKSNGKTLPINLIFTEDSASGVTAKLTVSVPAGVSFSVNSMKNYMCNNVMGQIRSTGYVKKAPIATTPVVTQPQTSTKQDVETRLKKLRKLLDEKLITKSEYKRKKAKILDDL
jgi:hypothetical protein